MATAKSLQIPQILGINGSTFTIRHPILDNNSKTFLIAPLAAAGTALSVADNNGFADDDWMIFGTPGDETTEECDVNGAVTRGQSITVTNSNKFAHEQSAPLTKIYERKITVYGATTNGGTPVAIYGTGSAKSIQWNRPFTEITLTTAETAYAYYVFKFYDGTTESAVSDYIPSTGLTNSYVGDMISKALKVTNSEIDQLITYDFLIASAQDCQDEITQYVYMTKTGDSIKKDWPFEMTEDETSLSALTLEHKYAVSGLSNTLKYPDTKQAILSVRFGTKPLSNLDFRDIESIYQDVIVSELSVATTVGATSVTLTDSSMFSATNGSFQIGGETITFTTNTVSTGVLSGIPASGTGSIAAVYAVGRSVWQGAPSGKPQRCAVFNDDIILDRPPTSQYAGYKIKVRYIKKLPPLTRVTSSTEVTFTLAFKWYLAAQIALRRGKYEDAKVYMEEFNKILLMNAKGQRSETAEGYTYHSFVDGDGRADFPLDDRFPNSNPWQY